MDEAKEVRQIPIEDIIPNRFQPRINFDEKALNELAESIKQHGIIQPLVLRPLGDKFEIIAGERRYKAASLAGLSAVPAIVTEMDDGTSAEVALIENVQRKDLSSIEEAKSYKSMLDRGNMTQEELAKKMGLSQSTIANKIRLLNLSEDVQNALMQEKISERHARALLSIQDPEEQKKWLDRIIKERLTVRQLDLAIKDELSEKKMEEEGDIPKVNINPDIDSIINNAVDINPSQPPKNKLPIDDAPEQEQVNNNIDNNTQERPQGKFFNYLEDQEVNMSMSEEPVQENNEQSTSTFAFAPEFTDAPENQFVEQPVEEIETLDDDMETPVSTNEETDKPIFNLESNESVEPGVVNVNNSNVAETTLTPEEVQKQDLDVGEGTPYLEYLNKDNNEDNSEMVESMKKVIEEGEASQPQVIDNVQNETVEKTPAEEFIFDDDEETNDEVVQNIDNTVTNNSDVEPIPIAEGEGVVDPAAFYDTLDPQFMDKVKEYIGLDLKTAINSYRDLTNKLNNEGFNINIDEVDMDGKYHIEIDINKE